MAWTGLRGLLGRWGAGLCLVVLFCCSLLCEAPRALKHPARDLQQLLAGKVTEKTSTRRQMLLGKFEIWLVGELPDYTVDILAHDFPSHLSDWLSEFIRELYRSKSSLKDAAEVINALQSRYGFTKGFMGGPWNIISTWRSLEPPDNHPPMPLQVLKAMAMTAYSWGWWKISLVLLLGFFGLLRPIEFLRLKRSDCVLTSVAGVGDVLYLNIVAAKTRFTRAKHQSVKIDDPSILSFLKCLLNRYSSPKSPLWTGSPSTFRNRFKLLLTSLGLTNLRLLPSSLRTGAATHFFDLFDENIVKLLWRGRWASIRMLEIYVQELVALRLQMHLTRKQHELLTFLNDCFDELVTATV